MKIKSASNFKYDYTYIAERELAVNKAINFIKTCPYKGTAIKIELEAFLGRTGGSIRCHACDSVGEIVCPCEGIVHNCENCSGKGYLVCGACDGHGTIHSNDVQRTEDYCQKFILKNVSRLARKHLIFSKTYWDHSVDTEFTFTLPIEHVRDAIEFIKAFAKLGEDIGNGVKTHGAGMHIAILNDPKGNYGGNDKNKLSQRHSKNFISSMTHMLPALYFLASPDDQSRKLNFRQPKVSLTDKSVAISGCHKVWEYRVFETCYDRPEAILDNICVIANTLKYYSYRPIRHKFFGKIGKFGFHDMTQGLERFYRTEINYRALMAGVKILRPSYKTISELRKERNFKVTLTKIRNNDLQKEKIWSNEFLQERKNIKELKEDYKKEYKELSRDPSFKKRYPTSVAYINYILPDVKILKESKDKFIDEKKKISMQVIKETINI